MSVKQLCISVLLFATMVAAPAVGQDGKNEVGGNFGHIFISDQGIKGATFTDPIIHAGKGWTFDLEYARRFIVAPIFAVSGEVLFAYNPDEDLNGGGYLNAVVPSHIKQIFITPAARVNLFPTTAVSPWVSFGAGFGHFSESNMLVYGGTNPGKSTTSAVIEGGIGLDVRVWRKLSIRGGVRDFWSGEPDYPLAPTGKSRQHNFFVSGGAFWRF
jgi:outer membrane protein with beta-barrel domain